MSMTADGSGREPEYDWIRSEADRLNFDTFEGTDNSQMNAFVSMYRLLPEHKIANAIGADMVVDLLGDSRNMEMRPVAIYGKGIVVFDRSGPRTSQDDERFLYLHGSVFAAKQGAQECTDEEALVCAQAMITNGAGGVNVTEDGIMYAYTPENFCREGRLVYNAVHTMEGLRTKAVRAKSVKIPLEGSVITVMVKPNQPRQLFVEHKALISPPVRNVYQRLGDTYLSLLDYITE